MRFGDDFVTRGSVFSNTIGTIQPVVITTTRPTAKIVIGNKVGISGCTLECQTSIEIGHRVCIGSGVLIMDNDAHSLDHGDRENNILNIRSSPICIGDDVFIGARSILLKGVKIGARTIVRAGSVVLGEFPPDCIIGGNPAVIVSTKR